MDGNRFDSIAVAFARPASRRAAARALAGGALAALLGVRAARDTAAFSASRYCPDAQERRFLRLINNYRARNNLGPLKLVRTLGAAAEHHSRDMGRRDFFDHVTPDGTDATERAEQHGYDCGFFCGENIMWGSDADTADEAFAVWQASAPHNANMLDPNYRAIGIGRHFDADFAGDPPYRGPAYLWTTSFGGQTAAGPTC